MLVSCSFSPSTSTSPSSSPSTFSSAGNLLERGVSSGRFVSCIDGISPALPVSTWDDVDAVSGVRLLKMPADLAVKTGNARGSCVMALFILSGTRPGRKVGALNAKFNTVDGPATGAIPSEKKPLLRGSCSPKSREPGDENPDEEEGGVSTLWPDPKRLLLWEGDSLEISAASVCQ